MALIDWNNDGPVAGHVLVNGLKFYLRVSGPPRQPGQPAIIIETGLGDSSIAWSAVSRLTSSFARIYTYDRAGLGASQTSSKPRSGQNMASELSSLFKAARIAPPYVLVSHSAGCLVAREFVAINPSHVVGMVMVEGNTEFSYKVRPEDLVIIISVLSKDLDQYQVTNTHNRHKLTPEEWTALTTKDNPQEAKRHGNTALQEYLEYEATADTLARRKQYEKAILGDKPISVIKGEEFKDTQLLLDAAIKKGNGSDFEWDVIRRWIGMDGEETRLQREQLRLSTNGRFVNAWLSGHDVHLTEPEVIVDEIRWVLRENGIDV